MTVSSNVRPARFRPVTRVGCVNRIASLLIVFATVGPLSAQDDYSNPDTLRDDVLEWIDELDADAAAIRQAAERSLIEAGAETLSWLPEPDDPRLSPEAADRIRRIVEVLRKQQAAREVADIRIDLGDVSNLGEALEAISRDSGVEFECNSDRTQPVDPVATPLTFWHAIDLVLDQAELDINFYGGDRETLMLTPRDEDRPDRVGAAVYAGIYRIEPTSVTARRILRQPSLSGLNVSMEIAWEPRITPIGLTIPVDQIAVTLDSGQRLQSQASSETIDVATASDIAFSEFYLPLELPAAKASKIQRIGGVIQALLPGRRKRFTVPLVGTPDAVSIDAMTVKRLDVRPNGPLHEVRLSITIENADRALESHRQWLMDNEIFLVAPDDTRVDHLGFQVFRQTTEELGIGYLFDVGDDPTGYRLKYLSPTAVIRNEVPFVLQDIPLP